MEELLDTKEEFALVKRAKSFAYAGRGVYVFLRTTPNAWIQLALFAFVFVLGMYFHITRIEWILLIMSGGFVIVAEAFNTALEIDINLTSPEPHPYARDTKDVAAGAVLIASIVALVVGIVVFFPYVLAKMIDGIS